MAKVHNLGFPRIGSMRELKFAQESYWSGKSSKEDLLKVAGEIRKINWNHQKSLDWVAVGDFSLYDQVLDMSFTLGNTPQRARDYSGDELDNYFRVARGRSVDPKDAISAAEMTKWFDTNYHYMVPEFDATTTFKLNPTRVVAQIIEAKNLGFNPKPVIIGPVTYLAIGKEKDNSNKLDLLPKLLDVYAELLEVFAEHKIEWVQIDEPILVTELSGELKKAFEVSYSKLNTSKLKILLATYFGTLQDNLDIIAKLPIAGLHIDAINGRGEVDSVISKMSGKVISLGVVNGRNIWKSDLNGILDWLEPIAKKLGDNLWIAPSCSLLHVPVDLASEKKLDTEVLSWLAFAIQKIKEIEVIAAAINFGRAK
ncbi:MAG: 5-methyltetrahydropteroyltriglutamate--homocysteine S-methyltransferase, partial [Actinobacteria bacterium]|nr:5-methyltetrahydropteroyltriglutamate--homocysteine S-methyltransferase [Actinomycetota bacterium]